MPKPSTNSDWIRSTRQGSVCTQSEGPRVSSSRWSVVLDSTWVRRVTTRPRCFSGVRLAEAVSADGSVTSGAGSPGVRTDGPDDVDDVDDTEDTDGAEDAEVDGSS
ncbi:hypothetical protein GCM10009872_10320 [Actinopolymorpha rutila]